MSDPKSITELIKQRRKEERIQREKAERVARSEKLSKRRAQRERQRKAEDTSRQMSEDYAKMVSAVDKSIRDASLAMSRAIREAQSLTYPRHSVYGRNHAKLLGELQRASASVSSISRASVRNVDLSDPDMGNVE